MRKMSRRLGAAMALIGIAPGAMAQDSAPLITTNCTARYNAGPSIKVNYSGVYNVFDSKLALDQHYVQLNVSPEKSWTDPKTVTAHGGTPLLALQYDAKVALYEVQFSDGGFTFARAPQTIGLSITSGGKSIFTASVPYAKTDLPSIGKKLEANLFGTLHAVTVEVLADGKAVARYTFAVEGTKLVATATRMAELGRKQFVGTAYDGKLATGGRADTACTTRAASNSACFLTTAAVEAIGLDDDCWELRQLRALRDRFAALGASEAAIMADYYAYAPSVVRTVGARDDAARIWRRVYFAAIVPAAIAARCGWDKAALAIYARMTRRMRALA